MWGDAFDETDLRLISLRVRGGVREGTSLREARREIREVVYLRGPCF